MKKLILLLVLMAMLLGICGCTGGTDETKAMESDYVSGSFNVGYAIADITPKESVPLAGFGVSTKRMANDVEYALKATALAVTGDNGQTVILIETDMTTVISSWLDVARARISEATGVPEAQIMIGASHTHAAPDMAKTSVEAIGTYFTELVNALVQVSAEAMADRKPAEISCGSSETESLNFVRNYYNVEEDGRIAYWGDNHGYEYSVDDTTQHTTQADPTLHILKITRENEKNIILVNYRAHPHLDCNSSTYAVSADFVGAMREAVQLSLDADFMFLQGASGNINAYSKISSENRTTECPEYAALMMEYVNEALDNMTLLDPRSVQFRQTLLEVTVNHELDDLLVKAKEVAAVWNANRDLDGALALAAPYGIYSPFHANAIVSRAAMSETDKIELNVITIGERLAIATAPLELFDTLGRMIEEGSPYDNVLIMGYTGNYRGYMPDRSTFETGSYEADVCKYVAGTGEQIVGVFLDMMETMKNG